MGRIVLSEFLTLDGVMQSPGSAHETRAAGSPRADGSSQ